MRCPKCGFISFDHLTSCAKCGKDIAEVASELQGTSIKVETPMFLSTALAAYSDNEDSFEEIGMEDELDEGIDFSMDDKSAGEETVKMGGAEADVDFSFEEEEAGPDINLAEVEEEALSMDVEAEEAVEFSVPGPTLAKEAAPEAADESFEVELDFEDTGDEGEEGGLEFDLEDFIEDMDDDKSNSSSSQVIDIDLDDDGK